MSCEGDLTFDPAEYPGGVVYTDQRPESFPALMVVLNAIDKAGDRNAVRRKFQLVNIACPQQHRVAEVFRTMAGPIVYGLGRAGSGILGKERLGNLRLGVTEGQNRSDPRADRLTPPFGPDDVDVLMFQCLCQEAIIPRSWIAAQVSAKRRRVVWKDGMLL